MLVIKQLPVAFGFASAAQALCPIPDDAQALGAWRNAFGAVTEDALIVASVSLALLFAWDSPRLKRTPVLGRLPGPLLGVVWASATTQSCS